MEGRKTQQFAIIFYLQGGFVIQPLVSSSLVSTSSFSLHCCPTVTCGYYGTSRPTLAQEQGVIVANFLPASEALTSAQTEIKGVYLSEGQQVLSTTSRCYTFGIRIKKRRVRYHILAKEKKDVSCFQRLRLIGRSTSHCSVYFTRGLWTRR
jgi:hypothetical protein